MKKSFVLASVILAAGSLTPAVAAVVGVLPSSFATAEAFVGCFAAAGVLAMFFHEYSRQATYDVRRVQSPTRLPKAVSQPATPRDAAWVRTTISA